MTDRLLTLFAVLAAVPMWLLDAGQAAAAITAVTVLLGLMWRIGLRVYRNLVSAVRGIVHEEIRPLREAIGACEIELVQIKRSVAEDGSG